MAKVTGSYPSVTRGVSEQVPQDRLPGQHFEQINMISDPVRGLARRHGSVLQEEKIVGDYDPTTLTGIAATLVRTVSGRTLTAAAGEFALTGQAAVARAGRRLAAASEPYVWSRLAAALRWTRSLPAAAGDFALSGGSIGWGWTHIMTPAPASFAMSGQAATLRFSGGQGWQPVPTTGEDWTVKPSTPEPWTPVGDTSEIWS